MHGVRSVLSYIIGKQTLRLDDSSSMGGKLCKRVLNQTRSSCGNTSCQSMHGSVEGSLILRSLSRGEWARDQIRVELSENGSRNEVFPFASSCRLWPRAHWRAAVVALEGCSTGRTILKPLEYFIDFRMHVPVGPLPRSEQRRPGNIGRTTSEFYRQSPFTARLVLLKSKPLHRWLHGKSKQLATTAKEMGEETVNCQEIEHIEEEMHSSLARQPLLLDLPKYENLTTIIIGKVCRILDVQEWGPETMEELETEEVIFSPFLIASIIEKLQNNVDVTWSFFQWARGKAKRKLSLRAYVAVLDALGRAKKFEVMKQVFPLIYEDGYQRSAWPYNNALKWCCEANNMQSALYFWNKMTSDNCKPTVLTYTRLIHLQARQGYHHEALKSFREMLQNSCPPNISTYNVLMHAFGVAGQPEVASALFVELSELGCKPNYSTYETLITLHVDSGSPEKALKYVNMVKAAGMDVGSALYRKLHMALLNRRATQVVTTGNTDSSGAGDGPVASTRQLKIDLSSPGHLAGRHIYPKNLVKLLEKGEALTVEEKLEKIRPKLYPPFVVQVLRRLKNPGTALIFFDWAKSQPDFKHNEYTYTMMISILARSFRYIASVERIIKEMQEQVGFTMNTPMFTVLIKSYGRTQSLEMALKLFEQMKLQGCKPDVIAYTCIIHLIAKHGDYKQAVRLFEEMQQAGITPNTNTYSVMIYNFLKAANVTEALALLKQMPGLGCQPTSVTFGTLIDHFAKAGQLEMAESLCSQMEKEGITPLRTTIAGLDGAFRKAGKIDDAEKLVERFKWRRTWDGMYKSSTERVAQQLLLRDIANGEWDTQSRVH